MNRFLMPAVVVCVGFSAVLAQLHPFGNPWRDQRADAGLLRDSSLPPETRAVLVNKCADCHSQATHAPVYAMMAPVSWLIERDIMRARARMDLSRWEETPQEQKDVLAQEIVQQAKNGAMPPLQYRLLHWSARLSPDDVRGLELLKESEREMPAAQQEAGDAARGRLVFQRRCMGCHALDENREGPMLRGVYGRKAGSVAGFHYSAGLMRSGLTWDAATLDQWLMDPDAMVRDNKMSFETPKAEDRRDLIAYLQSAADK
jgi:cytochrome c